MSLEKTILRETRSRRTHTDSTQEVPRGVRSRDRKYLVGPPAGGGAGESVFHEDRASVWEDEDVLEMIVRVIPRQRECT